MLKALFGEDIAKKMASSIEEKVVDKIAKENPNFSAEKMKIDNDKNEIERSKLCLEREKFVFEKSHKEASYIKPARIAARAALGGAGIRSFATVSSTLILGGLTYKYVKKVEEDARIINTLNSNLTLSYISAESQSNVNSENLRDAESNLSADFLPGYNARKMDRERDRIAQLDKQKRQVGLNLVLPEEAILPRP